MTRKSTGIKNDFVKNETTVDYAILENCQYV